MTDNHSTQPDTEAAAADADRDLELVLTDELAVEPRIDSPTAAQLGLELPDDGDEAIALLLRELAEARGEASEYLETLQRLAADFENYRKRVERDQVENVRRSSQRLIEKLLPTLDAFDGALGYEPQTPAEEKLLDGMRSTHTQLMDSLIAEGLAPIDAKGAPFDPAFHEAVAGGGDGDLVVAQELRKGYILQGRVLRPSMVVVEEAS